MALNAYIISLRWYTPLVLPNRLMALVITGPLSRGDRLIQNAEGDFEKAGASTRNGYKTKT